MQVERCIVGGDKEFVGLLAVDGKAPLVETVNPAVGEVAHDDVGVPDLRDLVLQVFEDLRLTLLRRIVRGLPVDLGVAPHQKDCHRSPGQYLVHVPGSH